MLDFKEKDARLKEVERLFGSMKDEHHALKKRRHDEFMQGFGIIS
jgi:structural maintenance of chromosome 4